MSATPKVGTNVRIKLETDNSESYRSRVADVDENFLYVDIPVSMRHGKELEVWVDRELSIEYNATETEVYRYMSPMLGIAYIPTPTIRLTAPEKAKDLERIQRREFFRISMDAVVSVFRQGMTDPFRFQSVDVSGGGLAVKTRDKVQLTQNEVVSISVTLPYTGYHLEVPCRVVRVDVNPDGESLVSMAFENIKDREREQVVRYTFMRQRAIKR